MVECESFAVKYSKKAKLFSVDLQIVSSFRAFLLLSDYWSASETNGQLAQASPAPHLFATHQSRVDVE